MMQENYIFWLLICGHLLGDFYLQSEDLVNKKKQKSFLGLHGVIYFIAIFVMLSPIMSSKIFAVTILIAASHVIIDFLKLSVINSAQDNNYVKKNIFFLDQIFHLVIIIIVAYNLAINNMIALNSLGRTLLEIYYNLQIMLNPLDCLKIMFVLLVIGKPANIIINEINKKENIKKSFAADPSEYQNAGKIIGILERIIIVVMLILKEYAAIGLVLTAKSITRYDKITKEPSFAEYYLVGTLLSVLIAVIAVLLIQPI